MKKNTRAYIDLHIAVLLFGFTAILGDIITLPALSIVWWRVLITSFSFVFIIRAARVFRKLSTKTVLIFSVIGIITALHWLAFYGAIKLSNASITLVCLATTTFFTAFMEPLILKKRFNWFELAIGIMIIPGMALIVQSTPSDFNLGIVVGLLSAFLAALFATFNKKYIDRASPMEISFIELTAATVFLTPIILYYVLKNDIAFWPTKLDWFYLVILALLCTTLAYVLAVRALRHISAFASNLTINLEPVYGIVLAWLILKEHKELNTEFYVGVGLILLAVFSYPIIKRKMRKANDRQSNS